MRLLNRRGPQVILPVFGKSYLVILSFGSEEGRGILDVKEGLTVCTSSSYVAGKEPWVFSV